MNVHKGATAIFCGILLVIVGVIFNRWSLEAAMPAGRRLDGISMNLAILACQVSLIGSGLWLIIRRPPGRDLALFLVSITLALGIAEASARIWLNRLASDELKAVYLMYTDFEEQQRQWSPHHYLNYFPTPNFRKGELSHNSLGYRGPEFSVRKPKETHRIAILGGSSVYTIAVEENEKSFPAQLERLLQQEYGYENIEVINAGVGGYNSWESLINLEFRVLDLEPDMIIIYHGTNDVHTRLVPPESYRGDNSGRRKQWEAPTGLLYSAVEHSYLIRIIGIRWGLFGGIGLRHFVVTPKFQGVNSEGPTRDLMQLLDENPPIYFQRNLENMIAIAEAHSIKVILATWANSPFFGDYVSTKHYKRGFDENNAVVREIARNNDVLLFDFTSVMPIDPVYWADGAHVNEKGALLKAKLFAEFLHSSANIRGQSQTPQ